MIKPTQKGKVALPEFCLKPLRYLLETGHAPSGGGAENLYLLYMGKFRQSFLKRLVHVV